VPGLQDLTDDLDVDGHHPLGVGRPRYGQQNVSKQKIRMATAGKRGKGKTYTRSPDPLGPGNMIRRPTDGTLPRVLVYAQAVHYLVTCQYCNGKSEHRTKTWLHTTSSLAVTPQIEGAREIRRLFVDRCPKCRHLTEAGLAPSSGTRGTNWWTRRPSEYSCIQGYFRKIR